jgi:hypothetical protein
MTRHSGPIRRAQLVGPSGVGSIIVSTDGTTMIAAGLDHWFERDNLNHQVDVNEFKVEEWRLQRELAVDHFRLPPDFREPRTGQSIPNTLITIPYLRFPCWHVCRWCHTLSYSNSATRGVIRCTRCSRGNRRGPVMAQVPFIAMCEYGHIQEFPWNEWVHESLMPTCRGQLRLQATGAASLGAIRVSCSCGASRTLARITDASSTEDGEYTHLSRNLTRDDSEYRCRGAMPWHDNVAGAGCDHQMRGALLSASNTYFGLTRSAIYLPRSSELVSAELMQVMERPDIAKYIRQVETTESRDLRNLDYSALQSFTDEQIDQAIKIARTPSQATEKDNRTELIGDAPETRFRREEFRILRTPRKEDQLLIREVDLLNYDEATQGYFEKVMLVDKLRETRVQYGFNRVFPENLYDVENRKSLFWKDRPSPQNDWLPAYIVYGEGIFLELSQSRLSVWEKRPGVISRMSRLQRQYQQIQTKRRLHDRYISPRFVLLHTFAHLLINRLAFECGYSAASLKERLYVSDDSREPMAGLLIYTAAGDSEGTLGGLVRMGKPGNLEAVIRRALEVAEWCSSDPVCMELGEAAGQGPDAANLAACHSCALVPETACEEFNRFLDRGTVVGTFDERSLGYFRY